MGRCVYRYVSILYRTDQSLLLPVLMPRLFREDYRYGYLYLRAG